MAYNLNGNIITNQSLQLPINQNGSFWYGDGFFDTLVYTNGMIHFSKFHWDRLLAGCQILKITNPFKNEADFGNNVKLLANLTPDIPQRIKLIIWRHSFQGYQIANSDSEFLITSSVLTSKPYNLNINGLSLTTYTDHLKSFSALGNVKSASSVLYVLATQFAQSCGADDSIILNTYGRPIETARMNFYLMYGNKLVTPGLNEGCLDGIMRRVILHICLEHGINLVERPVEKEELDACDGVILSNATRGIQWACKVNERILDAPPIVFQLSNWLNALAG